MQLLILVPLQVPAPVQVVYQHQWSMALQLVQVQGQVLSLLQWSVVSRGGSPVVRQLRAWVLQWQQERQERQQQLSEQSRLRPRALLQLSTHCYCRVLFIK